VEGLRGFLEGKVLSWTLGEALDPDKLERLGRYEVHLDRRLERMHTMLLRADLFGKTEVHPFGVARASRQAGLTIVTH
jgi:hypothetical protein